MCECVISWTHLSSHIFDMNPLSLAATNLIQLRPKQLLNGFSGKIDVV